jgi:hypothetical protein
MIVDIFDNVDIMSYASFASFATFASFILYLAYKQFHNSIFYMEIGNFKKIQISLKNGENRFLDSRLV